MSAPTPPDDIQPQKSKRTYLITPVAGTCPRCHGDDCYTLRLLDDEPIVLCLDCIKERVRKRIETEIHELYRYACSEQLAGDEIDLRMVTTRQRLKVIERLTLNYQKIRRLK
jgi:hypothetical protein